MKKLAIVMSFLVAVTLSAQAVLYSDWASGTGGATAKDPATTADLTSANATWTLSAGEGDSISVGNDQSISLDFCDSASTLTLALDAEAAPDSKVLTCITADVAFVHYDMTTPPAAPSADTQVALIVGVKGEDVSYYTYCATTDGGEKGWVKISHPDVVPPAEGDFAKVLIEIDVSGRANVVESGEQPITVTVPVARISIVTDGGTKAMTNGLFYAGQTVDCWFRLPSAAADEVGSIVMTGSGSVKNIDTQMRLGAALNGGVKYTDFSEAVALAGSPDTTVTLQRNILASEQSDFGDEGCVIEEGITLNLNGFTIGFPYTVQGDAEIAVPKDAPADLSNVTFEDSVVLNVSSTDTASGDLTVATGASDKDINKIDVHLSNANKEVASKTIDASGNLKCTVQTAEAQVKAVTGGGFTLWGTDTTSLRSFFENKATAAAKAVYDGAESSAANMQTALAANGENGLPQWQSFIFGLDANDSTSTLASEPTGSDASTEALAIRIPAVDTSVDSGVTVTYKLVDLSDSSETAIADPKAISIPLGSKSYRVKAVLSQKTKE